MRRRKAFLFRLIVPVALAVAGLATYAVLRDGGETAAAPASTGDTRPQPPACLRTGPARERPRELPAEFPFPGGTVLTDVRRQLVHRGRPPIVYVQGFAPVSLRDAVLFFARELPRRGFTPTGGDAEAWEADTKFLGRGRRGGLKIAGIPTCPRTVALLVGVLPIAKS